MNHIFQVRLFDATFGDFGANLVLRIVELAGDERRAYHFRSIDDFFDTWYTLGQIHACYPGKMEGFECHLRAGFADGLRSYCSDCVARFGLCLLVLFETGFDECGQGRFRKLRYAVDGFFG